ncbi:RdgB/HAM1 family non-canonical purine NTP pyrophosphatase [Salinicola sp. MIT1003]|uniref:RdgB/HAM1 family non-canonical purine NTP pyrophosphatase n=1 Tax=Salinicola sp. MIT1003 TaxID=1882734 RepID=UPI0008DD2001|nr:RdgB/HAM1 family non-canonical purine NTP pyrophosphatase [Salinicola sp. MIT1003]OHY99633.1 non-canonical purine NTP pyrophosphatase, RdgB/HAM1 family [Salinicola sp. MIT1003]
MSVQIDNLVVASGNRGKLAEFQQLLGPLGLRVQPQSDFGVTDVEETGLTFVENAILKARAAARASGLPALADDSGLAVDALAGAPGIYSARYAGEANNGESKDAANNAKLLAALKDVPEGERTARYWCVLVYLRHADDPVPLIVQCDWKGDILAYPRGNGGFGYDPLFWIPECGMSVAELSAEEKNRLSHRGRALQSLITQLKESGQVSE